MNNDLTKILVNAGWMVFDKIFYLLLNIVVIVKVANHYGPYDYGLFEYATSIVAIFGIVGSFIDGRVIKKSYRNNIELVVSTVTIGRLLLSIISSIIGLIFVCLFNFSQTFLAIFIALTLNNVVVEARYGMQNLFEFSLKSKKVVLSSEIAQLIGCTLQLVIVAKKYPIQYIAYVTMISAVLNFIILYSIYRKEFRRRLFSGFDCNLIKNFLIESFPLAIAASCNIVYTKCDSIMLGSMLSTSEVGIYSIAVKLVSILQIIINPVRESVYPKLIELYRNSPKKYSITYIKITSMLTWFYIVFAAVSIMILPIILRVFKPEYAPAFNIYCVYVIGSFFMFNAALRAGHYTLIKRGNILMIAQIISMIINVFLNYIGIRAVGMIGAAIATVITQSISLLFSNLLFGKEGQAVFLLQIKGMNPKYIMKKVE